MTTQQVISLFCFSSIIWMISCGDKNLQDEQKSVGEEVAEFRIENNEQSLVEGVIVQISRLPEAAKSDYPDCYYTATLEVVQIIEGLPIEKKIVLVLPGFYDRQYAPEAEYELDLKIRAVVKPFDSMPDAVKQVQQSDENEDFDLNYYFSEKSRPIDSFHKGQSVAYKNNENVTVEKVEFRVIDESARAERQLTIERDLEEINRLLARHGGDWDAWYEETAECRNELASKINENAVKWEGDSFFAASKCADDRLYTPAFVESMIAFNDYLAKRNVDLILMRVPFKGEICSDMFTQIPSDNVYNPYLLKLYKELLDANVEVVTGIIPAARENRLKYPLMYWYQDSEEHHPAEGVSMTMAQEISKRLERYQFMKTGPKKEYPLVETGGPGKGYNSFQWPGGNPKFDPQEYVRYATVHNNDGTTLTLSQSDESPILLAGSSYIAYPNMRRGGSVPHYLAHVTGVAPDILYRNGIDASVPRSLAHEGDQFIKNRDVCIFIVGPATCYRRLALPPMVNPIDVSKVKLAAHTGAGLKQIIHIPDGTDEEAFTFQPSGELVVKPLNKEYGPAGRIQMDLPGEISEYAMFIIEFEFMDRDYTNIRGTYEGQTDTVCRSISMDYMNDFLVFEFKGAFSVDLDFFRYISYARPTRLKTINIYGVQGGTK